MDCQGEVRDEFGAGDEQEDRYNSARPSVQAPEAISKS